eukprot:XP_011679952.1 PREDICTED: uncharacterized protein LOC105445737 [Strongylocentrotus purpuratus]
MDRLSSERREKNREFLKSIVETVLLCGRQNCVLRGHRDDSQYHDVDSNCGNFRAFLEFRSNGGDKLLEARISIVEISIALGVSHRTLYKYMQEHGIEHERHADITEHNLRAAIVAIKANRPDSGEVGICYVRRQRIRDILRDNDAEGIQRRRPHAVQRRVYSVPCPHFIWHADGNHEHNKWKFVLHGAIDGCTRMVTCLKVSDNNRAETVHARTR